MPLNVLGFVPTSIGTPTSGFEPALRIGSTFYIKSGTASHGLSEDLSEREAAYDLELLSDVVEKALVLAGYHKG
jgi:hypothetical protein